MHALGKGLIAILAEANEVEHDRRAGEVLEAVDRGPEPQHHSVPARLEPIHLKAQLHRADPCPYLAARSARAQPIVLEMRRQEPGCSRGVVRHQ
jgi:hypothetical protein